MILARDGEREVGARLDAYSGFDAKGKSNWLYVNVSGNDADGIKPENLIATKKVRIPPDFYNEVRAILKPGASLIVTEDSMEEGSPGEPVTVLSDS